ncbi:unannotated protein [freshwater metagenome]|uniref:Unannotated protein n=1 Tax=freshwater metagenome TaxID=449393 RepID=A0A6J7CUA8_9ZZZZ|nr:glycosyltransferase [Actinomycetota bacterium]
MKFHWFWPFARSEELDWARSTLRPGETLVTEVIDRAEAPAAGTTHGVTVLRDLPDVKRSVGRMGWAPSRAATYRERAAIRRRHWKSNEYDLFHLHYVNRFTDTFTRFPTPLVMSVHDVMPHNPRLGTRLEHQLLAHMYKRPNALIVHHARLADELHTTFGIPHARIHVVPHQVFPIDVEPSPRPEGPPLLLFFGAFRTNKGMEVLDEAMSLLGGQDVRLAIAGHGEKKLEDLALDMARRDERIHVSIGFATLREKQELFQAASVVVLPYTSFASQSGVLHDAYGHGRPVVVTDVGALGDTVRDERTGFVVPPRDAAGLATAIRRVLEPDQWDEAAAACKRIAHERSHAHIGIRLREVYDEVLR